MTDEALQKGLEEFSLLTDWGIKEIFEKNYSNRFSLAKGYVKPRGQNEEQRKFYDALKQAAEEEECKRKS